MAKSRARRIALRLALLGISAALGAAVLEGVHRTWRAAGGRPYSAAEAAAEVAEIGAPTWNAPRASDGSQALSRQLLHPYLGFDGGWAVRQTEQRLRAAAARRPDRYDVWVLGGSVAAGLCNTVRSELEDLLARTPALAGKKVRVWGQARSAFKQPQQVMALGYLLSLGLRPDAVINIDGLNEVAISNDNHAQGLHPVYPYAGRWLSSASLGSSSTARLVQYGRMRAMGVELSRAAEGVLAWGLCNSSVLGTWSLRRLRRMRSEWRLENERYLRAVSDRDRDRPLFGPEFPGGTADAVRSGVRAWTEGSRSLDAMCASHGVFYLHVLQPTLRDRGSKPLTKVERGRTKGTVPWDTGVELGYPLLRVAAESLRREGVAFLDCTMVFADVRETIYTDPSHFNRKGNLLLAAAIAEGFAARVR